jgi:hypothetical protein
MRGRCIVLDPADLQPTPPQVCPTCGAALSSVDRATLRQVEGILFRCLPGRHPRAYEARCGGCGRILIVLKDPGGLTLVGGDQDALLKWVRESDREGLEYRSGHDREPRGGR